MLIDPERAVELFGDARSIESVGADAGCIAVDLRSAPELDTTVVDRLQDGLASSPPWVNLAVIDADVAAHPGTAAVAERFDVVFAEAAEADALGSMIVAAPSPEGAVDQLAEHIADSRQAAVALAQLLRVGGDVSTAFGLYAESVTYATLQTSERFRAFIDARQASPATDGNAERVRVERDRSLLTITLTRSARRNALDVAMRDELVEAFELLATDPSIDGALWTGEGQNFCAGGDLAEFGTTPTAARGHDIRMLRSLPRLVDRVASRLRVHVHGSCVGAGIELPAFAHAVIADPDATFRLPEVGFGLVPGAGGTVSIAKRCGRHRAAWLGITGTEIDAQTALRWGLIDRIASRS